jgi:hypothetical protein
MKTIVATAAIGLAVVLGLQTYHSARSHNVAISCKAIQASDCLTLGSIGGVRKSGIRFVAKTFIRHGRDLPSRTRESIGNYANRLLSQLGA